MTATPVCAVSEGVRKHGPSAAFFSDLENRCQNLRRLHLSNTDINSPLPASVEVLTLSDCSLSPLGFPPSRFDAATQTVTSPRLRELELLSVELQRGALAAVPASVEKLRIRGTRLPRESFERLAQSDEGRAVDSPISVIDLSDSMQLTDVELHNITAAFPNISMLILNGCLNTRLEDFFVSLDIFENIAGRLEVLEADGVPFTPGNLFFLCPLIGDSLRRLSVAGCQLNGGLDIASELRNLRSLDVSRCGAYFCFGHLSQALEELEANGVPLSDGDVGDICRNVGGTVRRLGIAGCRLTDLGAAWIAADLKKLQSLDVSGDQRMTDTSFIVFASLRRSLRYLNVSWTNVDDDTVDLLRVCMPDCKVVH